MNILNSKVVRYKQMAPTKMTWNSSPKETPEENMKKLAIKRYTPKTARIHFFLLVKTLLETDSIGIFDKCLLLFSESPDSNTLCTEVLEFRGSEFNQIPGTFLNRVPFI
jgi:hypothetical protein